MTMTVKEAYVSTLQNFQYVPDIQASTWTFRTIKDLKSVRQRTDILTKGDKAKIFGRGMLALLAFLPVNLVAIPHVFILGAIQRKRNKPIPMSQLHYILPGLYLGTDQAAKSESILQSHNIKAVLSIFDREIVIPNEFEIQRKRISIEDYPHIDLAPAITEAIAFVEEAIFDGRTVLVHCQMGKSRSASIVMALVQKMERGTTQDAYNLVCRQRAVKGRTIISLNYGFKKQILQLPTIRDLEDVQAPCEIEESIECE